MKYITLLFLVFSMIGCTVSKRMIYLEPPKNTSLSTAEIAQLETKYGKCDAVYLNRDENIEHVCTNAPMGISQWKYNYVMHRRYVLMNPDEQRMTTFSLHVPKSATIGELYMQTISPQGAIKLYDKKDLIVENDKDRSKTYKFVYPNVEKGTIIDEGFELSYNALTIKPPLHHDIDLQFRNPCESLSFSYAYPDWWTINCKKISPAGPPQFTTTKDPENHKIIISYKAKKIPAIHSEPYSPYFKELAQYLEFMLTSLNLGAINYEAPSDWKKIGESAKPYLMERTGTFSTRVSDSTKAIIKTKNDDLSKIDTILSFVQENIEYVNDGEDRDFADVLKQKRGDAFEISGLTFAMLDKAGFSPKFLLIHPASEGYFDPSYYSFTQVNIPAIQVTAGSKEHILFPYRKDMPLSQIPEIIVDQPALAISPNGDVSIITVNGQNYISNSISDSCVMNIQNDGSIRAKDIKKFEGPMAMALRNKIAEYNTTEREKFIKKTLFYYEGDMKLNTFAFQDEKKYKSPLVMTCEYTADDILTLTPEESILQTGGLLSPVSIKDNLIDMQERFNPISIDFKENLHKVTVIQFPETWKLKTELKPTTIENNFGTLHISYLIDHSTITIYEDRILKKSKGTKEQIAELAALAGNKVNVVSSFVFTIQK